MRLAVVLLCTVVVCCAGIVDRIVVAVGQTVITELQLEEELRVTAFLNNQPMVIDLVQQRAAADRLVQQVLVERDMELSRYPELPEGVVEGEMQAIRSQYASVRMFEDKLSRYGISERVLQRHLALQARTLRFVGFRFRPDVNVSDDELKHYANKQQAQWLRENPGKALPADMQDLSLLKNRLLEERTDQALNSWLEETRNEVRIVYLDHALAPIN